ncbi:AEC family transporter [Roseicyclus marinus]|uniref:AEC family transporter n=1 Tax=Roseicyclus marinus TaxID=2161673 RepID=UPI0024101E39|nr:AEC family transporter [Roseicyclus marinus]MDG3040540.1 AEC family transporter [Roseicyclus marinus]
MLDILAIVLPVFLVVGAGYLAVWRKLFADSAVDGLMVFTQKFAIPCLLFSAIATLDLGADFDLSLLVSYYTGSTVSFFAGMFGARLFFGRPMVDSVVIGFCCLFANSVLLGLAIGERAYGVDSLGPNYAIIALHAPFCYLLGIVTMEIVRAEAGGMKLARTVVRAIFSNALMIGIGLGFVVNLSGLPIPDVVDDALALMIRAALPAALFGLGGVLYRYKPEGDMGVIVMICGISLLLHPAIAWTLGSTLGNLSQGQLRAAVVTAAMAPGVNTYIFADMYGAARRVVASSILIGTALTVFTASAWIWLLG